jgi:hypothetical protein
MLPSIVRESNHVFERSSAIQGAALQRPRCNANKPGVGLLSRLRKVTISASCSSLGHHDDRPDDAEAAQSTLSAHHDHAAQPVQDCTMTRRAVWIVA